MSARNLDGKALRHLLSLQEHNGWSLVLCGNDHRLKQTKVSESALGQISRRIDWRVSVGKPSKRDCELLCTEHDVAFPMVAMLTRLGMENSLDTLVKVLRRARQLGGTSGPIDQAKLNPAIASIFDPSLADKYLSFAPVAVLKPAKPKTAERTVT